MFRRAGLSSGSEAGTKPSSKRHAKRHPRRSYIIGHAGAVGRQVPTEVAGAGNGCHAAGPEMAKEGTVMATHPGAGAGAGAEAGAGAGARAGAAGDITFHEQQ